MDHRDLPVLLVVESDIATTQLIERLLLACRPFGVRYRKVYLAALAFTDLEPGVIPLFVRCADPALRLWIRLLHRAGHPYLYYLDDNFWELQGDSPVVRYYRDPQIRQCLQCAVSGARQVLTNSEALAVYLQQFTTRIRVLPPFFDFALIEGCVREDTPEFRIGFAGSSTRSDDLELIRAVIQPVLDHIPAAVFEFCGVLPVGIEPGPRVRFFPHMDSYAGFIRFQAARNWAIGLAPLLDTLANRAKTNNKYREYGACGIAGLYSNVQPYQSCVEPSVTGLLLEPSSESWLSAILLLAGQPDRREQIARRAQQDVRKKYCVRAVAASWAECLRESHTHLSGHPSHLPRAYWSGIVWERLAAHLRILGLQVQDAYRKGGAGMVLARTAQRVSAALSGVMRPR